MSEGEKRCPWGFDEALEPCVDACYGVQTPHMLPHTKSILVAPACQIINHLLLLPPSKPAKTAGGL